MTPAVPGTLSSPRPDTLVFRPRTCPAPGTGYSAMMGAGIRSARDRYLEQVRALQRYLDVPLRSNQIEISLMRLAPLYEGLDSGDGTLDQCMALGLTPLAWSPLGAAALMERVRPRMDPDRAQRVRAELERLAAPRDATLVQAALAWLLAHPAGIIPLVGSTDPAHIREAAGATRVTLGREEWYRLWVAAWGREVP